MTSIKPMSVTQFIRDHLLISQTEPYRQCQVREYGCFDLGDTTVVLVRATGFNAQTRQIEFMASGQVYFNNQQPV